jgi:hypothetical protein
MLKTVRTIALCLAGFVLLAFTVFVVNQTVQVVELAERLDPRFGLGVLWVLLVTYAVLLLTPVYLWLRLPPALAPAKSGEGPEFEQHLEALRKRLARNPRLGEAPLETREDVEGALATLSEGSDELIREAATRVFLTTAISQSGRLDALLVLSAHTRLVWRVAHLYYQRPTLRDMTYLYANVAATAFMAGELEDIDVSEQIQPVLSAVLGSAATAVPGLQTASTILVNSVLTGSANAFLTLRVGMIARQYCSTLVVEDRRVLRRSASAQAAMMLGGIASYGAKTLVKSVATASKKKVFGGGKKKHSDEPIVVTPKRRWFGR